MATKNSQFTALTADVYMNDVKVGALQTLTVDENWNMTRVGEIGSVVDILHVPGRYQVNLTARRMFVERDLVMSALSPLKNADVGSTDPLDVQTSLDTADQDADPATVSANVVADSPTLGRSDKVFHYSFDVSVKDAGGVEVFKINDCSITSRRRTLDQGAIIMAEDVNMIAKKVVLGNDLLGSGFEGL